MKPDDRMQTEKDDKMLKGEEFEILGSNEAPQPHSQHDYADMAHQSDDAAGNGGDDSFYILGYDPIKQPPKTEDLPPKPEGFFTKLKRRLLCLGRYHYIPLIIMILIAIIIIIVILSNL